MGRHKEYNRDEVLEKAMNLFWRKGFEGAHLQELVETTGLNRFSLYKEFGGKEGLFQAAMERYTEYLTDLSVDLRREPLGLENVRAYVRRVAETRFRYGCFLVNCMTGRDVLDATSLELVKQFAKGGESLLKQNLDAAKAAGALKPETDTRHLARFIMTFDIGLVTYDSMGPKLADKLALTTLLDRVLV